MAKLSTHKPNNSLTALEAALTDAGVSMENLWTDISRAAADLALFKPKDGNNFGGAWVRDVIAPGHEVGETWCAIIGAPDGKIYEVDFTIADKNVTVSGEPREVIQQVTYETAPVEAGDVEGHDFHGNQWTQNVAAAKAQSDKATAATQKANKDNTSESHLAALKENSKAQQLHTALAHQAKAAGDKIGQRTHEQIASEHDHARQQHFNKMQSLNASDLPLGETTPNTVPFEGASMVEAPTSKSAWDSFMAMAGGIQTVTLGCGGHPLTVTIDVNEAGAEALQAQLETVTKKSKQRAFNCFDHGGTKGRTEASSWPRKFWWGKKNGLEGIMEAAEPSDTGTAAINGKRYRGFSLTFFTDAEVKYLPKAKGGTPYIEAGARGSEENPAQIICHPLAAEHPEAFLNMGTLTNRPAVVANEPLFAATPPQKNSPPASAAARTAGAPTQTSKTTVMETKQLDAAALQERCGQLETKIAELTAADAAANRLELRALSAELEANQVNLKLAKQNEKIIQLEAAETKRKETAADEAVGQMINGQQIPMLDKELQASWKAKFIADPTLIPLIVKAKGSVRVTPGGNAQAMTAANHRFGYGDVGESPVRILKAIGEICKNQLSFQGMEASAVKGRGDLARELAMIWAKEIRGPLNAEGFPTVKPEFGLAPLEAAADTDTLGTLVGTLVTQRTLDLFTFKFPLISRILTDMSDQPSDLNQTVATRKITLPSVQTYDPTLDTDNRPKGWSTASPGTAVDVNITLDELVGVPIPFSMSALSSTQRNLFAEQAEAQVNALVEYFMAKIYAVCTAANFNAYAVANGGTVKNAYATYPVAEIDFARSHVTKIGAAFSDNRVPQEMRTLILNAQYYARGCNDPSLVTFFAGQQNPEIITDSQLPRLAKFALVEAPNFPATTNRVGMALQKNGLLAKSRLPNNIIDIFGGAGNGTATQVTHPETGFTMMIIRYVNNTRGFAEQIACAILGAAKGDTRGGLVLTSQ